MMKFILMIVFMNFMIVIGNMFLFMYFNLLYIMSLMMLLIYMFKSVYWTMISLSYGLNIYSFWLVLLSVWIIGLMFHSLNDMDWFKMCIFVNMLLILVIFFMSMDMMLFYLSFEVSLIPTFFLIVYWGSNFERVSAAYYLVIYMLLISFPLLVYIFKLFMFTFSFSFVLMLKYSENYMVGFWGFMMFFMAFFTKFPMYIVHVWLPKAHVEAPVYGSMILAGVLLKMGSYGLVRFGEIFFKIVIKYSYMIMGISIIGSLIAGMVTLMQLDMKSLVAYSSVVHMNLMLCGMMTLSKLGVSGGYIMMISHGLCSSGMFYMVNMFYSRTGSRLLVFNKGMINSMPTVCLWWFFFCVINFSYPFSLNFISEIMMLVVLVNLDIYLMLILMIICFYSSLYSLYLFSYVYHGWTMLVGNEFVLGAYISEYMVIIMHFFPLLFMLLNLIMFM